MKPKNPPIFSDELKADIQTSFLDNGECIQKEIARHILDRIANETIMATRQRNWTRLVEGEPLVKPMNHLLTSMEVGNVWIMRPTRVADPNQKGSILGIGLAQTKDKNGEDIVFAWIVSHMPLEIAMAVKRRYRGKGNWGNRGSFPTYWMIAPSRTPSGHSCAHVALPIMDARELWHDLVLHGFDLETHHVLVDEP